MTPEERFERIESTLNRIVDTQFQIDATMVSLADSHIRLAASHAKLAEAQAETAIQAKAAILAVEQLTEEMRATRREWQAYLSTIRQ